MINNENCCHFSHARICNLQEFYFVIYRCTVVDRLKFKSVLRGYIEMQNHLENQFALLDS